MKKQFLNFIAVIAFFTIAAAVSAAAQTVKIDIKFDFQVGEKVYPAGEYIIEKVNRQSNNALQIRNYAAGKEKTQLIAARAANAGKMIKPKLVFESDGKNFYLTEIFFDETGWGFSLPTAPRQEGNLAESKRVEVALKSSKKKK